jgi:phage baseplate assembly protein W
MPSPAEQQKVVLLGKDIFFKHDYSITAHGDYATVEGVDALRAAIYRRLLTRPGEFKVRPTYGVGVQDYVKKRRRATELNDLKARITDQLSLEERISEVADVVVELIPDGVKIGIAVIVAGETLKFQPFEFTEKQLIGTLEGI